MNIPYCGLNADCFSKISSYENIKDIMTLEVTHEGTNKVKESKINLLVHKYQLFKTNKNESISKMFISFIGTINRLKAL